MAVRIRHHPLAKGARFRADLGLDGENMYTIHYRAMMSHLRRRLDEVKGA